MSERVGDLDGEASECPGGQRALLDHVAAHLEHGQQRAVGGQIHIPHEAAVCVVPTVCDGRRLLHQCRVHLLLVVLATVQLHCGEAGEALQRVGQDAAL